MNILYIYKKGKEIIALEHFEAIDKHTQLIKEGFEHKSTINPSVVIENLLQCENEKELKIILNNLI
jgi:hypothetical protein